MFAPWPPVANIEATQADDLKGKAWSRVFAVVRSHLDLRPQPLSCLRRRPGRSGGNRVVKSVVRMHR
jgi:hypothetical protein